MSRRRLDKTRTQAKSFPEAYSAAATETEREPSGRIVTFNDPALTSRQKLLKVIRGFLTYIHSVIPRFRRA